MTAPTCQFCNGTGVWWPEDSPVSLACDHAPTHPEPRPDDEGRETVSLPRWMFSQTGARFLVILDPDGRASIDGGHGDAAGVAEARELRRRLAVIRHPAGARFLMVTVEDVPPFAGTLNEDAIATLNATSRALTPHPAPLGATDEGLREHHAVIDDALDKVICEQRMERRRLVVIHGSGHTATGSTALAVIDAYLEVLEAARAALRAALQAGPR